MNNRMFNRLTALLNGKRCASARNLIVFACTAGIVSTPVPTKGQSGPAVSLTLSQAIDLALKQNRDLKLAHLSIVEMQNKKDVARSDYYPHIKNESGLLHVTELAGVEIPEGAFGVTATIGAIPAKTLFIDQGAQTTYTSGTQLAQPFTQMFKIRESNRAAAADVATSRIQFARDENEIALKVRQLYFGILIGKLRLEASQDDVKASEKKSQESLDAVANGGALEIAALEGRASVLEAKQTWLTETLQIHNMTLNLDDLLGLPLSTQLALDADASALTLSLPTRDECIRIAHDESPSVRVAREAVVKARAGLGAAKDAYIPDVTGLARYSYQSGVPLLVHNFGTFGFSLTYDIFDGGRRSAEVADARTMLAQAQINLDKVGDEAAVTVESSYDKVEQLQSLVDVATEALDVRTEAARLADRQVEQHAALASAQSETQAKATSARASLLEATLGLSLAQGDVKRAIGQIPR